MWENVIDEVVGLEKRSGLTARQEKFAQGVAGGMTQADAYRAAYTTENMKQDTIHVKASELMASGKVAVRVAELKGELARKQLWTREKSVKALINAYNVAERQSQSGAMTAAVKELNAMHGYNEPVRIDHTTNGESLNRPWTATASMAAFLDADTDDT